MVAPRTHDGDADLLRKAANSIGSTIAAARVDIAVEFVLLCALRRIGLYETEYAKATCGIIRLELSR